MPHHGHGHGHGCDGDDNHDDTPETGLQYSLFKKIDSENLECLNERVENSGKQVFRAWEDRLNSEKVISLRCDSIYLFKEARSLFSSSKATSTKNYCLIYHLLETLNSRAS